MSEDPMPEGKHSRIVIFGATGRVGWLLVKEFHRAGHPILSVGRNAYTLSELPGTHVAMDLDDEAQASPSFIHPQDIVINTVHARYTRVIAELCPDHIEKYIVIGSTRYLSIIPDAKADEVRAAANDLESSTLPWVLLHPTMIYGAAGENNVQRMAALIQRFHIVPLPAGGKALIQPVHVDDVVDAVVSAARMPGLNQATIHLGGPEAIPYSAFLKVIADQSGSWVKVPSFPMILLRLAAFMTAITPGIPTIKDAEVLRLLEDKAVDASEMKKLLGVTPRPLKQGLAETFSK
jgi:nucleoside-diphosphate-sugar epimerase